MQAKDEDTIPEVANAVVDKVIEEAQAIENVIEEAVHNVTDEVVEQNTQDLAAADDQASDPTPTTEKPGLIEKLMSTDPQPEADKVEEVDAPVPIPDGAPAEEVVTDTDNTPEEVPVIEEPHIQEQPLEEEDNEIKAVQTEELPKKPIVEESSSRWSFNSIRSSFQKMNGYFDSLVELVGGRNGVCEYRCRYGELPQPRPGYQLPEPNGCSSSLVGFQIDLGIPAMTQCCNQLDTCYDTCGSSKYDCDSNFRSCLHDICSDLKKSLGLGTQVQTCESMADGLFNTVWTLGCRPYMNSQRAACFCHEEEKDEL